MNLDRRSFFGIASGIGITLLSGNPEDALAKIVEMSSSEKFPQGLYVQVAVNNNKGYAKENKRHLQTTIDDKLIHLQEMKSNSEKSIYTLVGPVEEENIGKLSDKILSINDSKGKPFFNKVCFVEIKDSQDGLSITYKSKVITLNSPEKEIKDNDKPKKISKKGNAVSLYELFCDVTKDVNRKYKKPIDPNLIASIGYVESKGDPYAMNHKCDWDGKSAYIYDPIKNKKLKLAIGIMQLTSDACSEIRIPFDPKLFEAPYNIYNGSLYLKWLLTRYSSIRLGDEKNRISLALAAYNGGITKIDEILSSSSTVNFEGIERFLPEETREYVPQVFAEYNKFKSGVIPAHFKKEILV